MMGYPINICRLINLQLQSNTYILYTDHHASIWVIDPGDFAPIELFIREHNYHLEGIFVTHCHFDHIYGINTLKEKYPKARIYASDKSKEGFRSSKLNGSYYAEFPFTVEDPDTVYVKEGDEINLWDGVRIVVYETPGHNEDCITFKVNEHLFTGDALIPGVKLHLKSKKADKDEAIKTIERIKKIFRDDTIVHPGHKKSCCLRDVAEIVKE